MAELNSAIWQQEPGWLQKKRQLATMLRARFPNRTNEEDYSPYNRVVGFDEKEQTVSVLSSDMENMALTVGSEMVINHHWYQSRFRIDSFFSNDHNF